MGFWTNRFWALFLIIGIVGAGIFFGLSSWEIAHIYSSKKADSRQYIEWLSYLGQSYTEVFIFLNKLSDELYNLWFLIAGWYRFWIIAAIVGAVIGILRSAKVKELRILPSGEIVVSEVRGLGSGIKLILPFPKRVSLKVLFSPQLRVLYRHNAINMSNLLLLSILIVIVKKAKVDDWWLLTALEDNQLLGQRLSPTRINNTRKLSPAFKSTIALLAQIYSGLRYCGAPTQATLAVLEALCGSASDYTNYQLAEIETAIKTAEKTPNDWNGPVESLFAVLALGPDSEKANTIRTTTILKDIEELLTNRLSDEFIVGSSEIKNELFFHKNTLFVPLRKITSVVTTLLGQELIDQTVELSKRLEQKDCVPCFSNTISQNPIFLELIKLNLDTDSQAKLSRLLKIPFKLIPDVQLTLILLNAVGWFEQHIQTYSAGNIYLVERMDEHTRELRRACLVVNHEKLNRRWGSSWRETIRTLDNLRLTTVEFDQRQPKAVASKGLE